MKWAKIIGRVIIPFLPIITAGCFGVVSSAWAQNHSYFWRPEIDSAETIAARIPPPEGFRRMPVDDGSFGEWLRYLPLKEGRPGVHLYDGSLKGNQEAHQAVIDIDVGRENLQQCADAVIRLRAEYLYSRAEYDSIHFNFTSGDTAWYRAWVDGYRPWIAGDRALWEKSVPPDSSYENFLKYLKTVFSYAGSYSLSRELDRVGDPDRIQIGDVFIQGGFPGHAVLVVDLAVNEDEGKQVFLLAQSFMPAQEIHLLKNLEDSLLSPWYILDRGEVLLTPEWSFSRYDLMRF